MSKKPFIYIVRYFLCRNRVNDFIFVNKLQFLVKFLLHKLINDNKNERKVVYPVTLRNLLVLKKYIYILTYTVFLQTVRDR